MKVEKEKNAIFKATIRHDGKIVAAVAALVGGKARLFIVQAKETPDIFIGRISRWIKEQGGEGLEMQSPDMLPEGIDVGAVIMRLKSALGVERNEPDASEYEVQNAQLVWSQLSGGKSHTN